ncbi:DUF4870 domain-containing protein, partial [Nocardiopsis rhodophaea]
PHHPQQQPQQPAFGQPPQPGMGYDQQQFPQPGFAQQPGAADDTTWAMIAHLSGLIMACLGWLPALIVFQVKKTHSAYVRHHASEALNFQLTLLIPYALSWIVFLGLGVFYPDQSWIGSVLIAVFWALAIVFGVLGALGANKGAWYRYPLAIRIVK